MEKEYRGRHRAKGKAARESRKRDRVPTQYTGRHSTEKVLHGASR